MKKARVVWLPSARDDLSRIRNYIAQQAPTTAEKFIRKLENASKKLRDFPRIGGIATELEHLELRDLIRGNYRIIYRNRLNQVEILGVFHTAQILNERMVRGI